MEDYRGLAILATNLKAHLDRAFLRRLRFVAEFPFHRCGAPPTEVYDEVILEVQRVFSSPDSTPQQRRTAKQSLGDMTALLLAHTVATVQGRTALLSGLIVELTQVIYSVRTQPPYAGAVKQLTGLVDKATALLNKEKKGLV